MNPSQEDDFINQELSISEYVSEIIKSFREISDKEFVINLSQNSNSFKISKISDFSAALESFSKGDKIAVFGVRNSSNIIVSLTIE